MSVLGRNFLWSEVFVRKCSDPQMRRRALLENFADNELRSADARIMHRARILVVEQIAVGAVAKQKLSGLAAETRKRSTKVSHRSTRTHLTQLIVVCD